MLFQDVHDDPLGVLPVASMCFARGFGIPCVSGCEAIDIDEVDETSIGRVGQLIGKTNQFNLTTRRHSIDTVNEIRDDPDAIVMAVRMRDRFGDYGLVGVVIAVPDDGSGSKTLSIDTWLMSCRVLGRRVEEAVLAELAREARAAGASELIGRFIPSEKNMMVAKHYEKLGFEKIAETKQGMILVTGPTGSGKTTTLYTAMAELNKPDTNLVTVEDPVEYELDGATQVQVDVKAERTFASALRSILRQDPDICMVGEIRDSETASIAVQAALTGHLVLSTLHTNDSAATIGRLVDIGVPPYMIASSVTMVLSQRLGRRLCQKCRHVRQSNPHIVPSLRQRSSDWRQRLIA